MTSGGPPPGPAAGPCAIGRRLGHLLLALAATLTVVVGLVCSAPVSTTLAIAHYEAVAYTYDATVYAYDASTSLSTAHATAVAAVRGLPSGPAAASWGDPSRHRRRRSCRRNRSGPRPRSERRAKRSCNRTVRPESESGGCRASIGHPRQFADERGATSLYQLYDLEGNYLKTGITSNPAGRYTQDFISDKFMDIINVGPRTNRMDLERLIVSHDPGPLNFEPWAVAAR